MKAVTIFCGSSRQCEPVYLEAAAQLGRAFAREGITIVYGGGAVGLMGAMADAALAEGGRVIGIIPEFMRDLEWAHAGVSTLRVVKDMHERKKLLALESDAVVALPGGVGTLEELLEVLSFKRLGLYTHPVVILNLRDFYLPLKHLLHRAVAEHFLDARHERMWTFVNLVEDVLPALQSAAEWDARSARDLAVP